MLFGPTHIFGFKLELMLEIVLVIFFFLFLFLLRFALGFPCNKKTDVKLFLSKFLVLATSSNTTYSYTDLRVAARVATKSHIS